MAFELVDDAADGGLFDGSHDWKDYLGAGVAGALGGLGGKPAVQAIFSVAGSLGDAAFSGDFAEDGVGSTLFGIGLSCLFSMGISKGINNRVINKRVSFLKKQKSNNVANRKLKAMGVKIKIGSHAANAERGLFKAIQDQDKWIGNILSDNLVSAITGGFVSLGYGAVSNRYSWYF